MQIGTFMKIFKLIEVKEVSNIFPLFFLKLFFAAPWPAKLHESASWNDRKGNEQGRGVDQEVDRGDLPTAERKPIPSTQF